MRSPEHPTNRAILYARVSTWDKQHPEAQLDQLRAVARQRGWIVVAELTDRISGAKDRRPGLDGALDVIRHAGANLLAATALDRVGRSLPHVLSVDRQITESGGSLVLLRENVDTATPMGRFAFSIMGAAAELERGLICERVRAGLAYARSQGRIGGRPPTLDQAPATLARALARRADGASWGDLARELGGTRGAWSRALGRAA